jgi:stearoyl-CoA desaturase (Delta-9 desaturase)
MDQSNLSFKAVTPPRQVCWANVIYLVASPILALTLVPYYLYQHGFDWRIWLFSLVLGCATSVSITGGYHRLFAHRSYSAKPWVKIFYLLFGGASFQGSVLKWATDHRRHHRYVDTEKDPYNINQGFFYAHIGWLLVEDDPRFRDQFPQDLLEDKGVYYQHKYYLWVAFVMGVGFPTLIGYFLGSALGGFAVGAALRLVMTNHSTFFINSLCHTLGRQPYSDEHSARDSYLMAFLAFGEGYHNFHHQFQSDYRNGIRWFDWDPTKWFVNFLTYVGSASNLKTVSQATIVRARVVMEEKRLIRAGVPAESIHHFRLKVEEASKKWRALREDYLAMKESMKERSQEKLKAMKTDMKERSHEKLKTMKAEMKRSQREFKTAWALWMAYGRHARTSVRVCGNHGDSSSR